MSENTPATVTPTPNPATPPADPKGSGATTPPSEGSIMIPKQRLDETAAQRDKALADLEALKAEKVAADQKQLEDNKKFEELWKQEKEKSTANETRVQEVLRRAAFMSAISGKGIASPDDAYILAKPQLDGLKVDGDKVVGIDEVIGKLVETKPFLLGKAAPAPVGAPTNPAPTGGQQPTAGKIWTTTEINALPQPDFEKNQVDIMKAQAEGRIRPQ